MRARRNLLRRTAACRACGLGCLELPRCVGFGPASAEVAIVGLNPSVRAAGAGCVGCFLIPTLARLGRRAAALKLQGAARAFYHLSREAGVDLRRVYATNAVKCATPGNRALSPEEVRTCGTTHLTTELETLPNLRTVLVFGAAAGAFLGLSDFGARTRVEGTLAEAVLLRHPISTLRKWTNLGRDARRLREAFGPARIS